RYRLRWRAKPKAAAPLEASLPPATLCQLSFRKLNCRSSDSRKIVRDRTPASAAKHHLKLGHRCVEVCIVHSSLPAFERQPGMCGIKLTRVEDDHRHMPAPGRAPDAVP